MVCLKFDLYRRGQKGDSLVQAKIQHGLLPAAVSAHIVKRYWDDGVVVAGNVDSIEGGFTLTSRPKMTTGMKFTLRVRGLSAFQRSLSSKR